MNLFDANERPLRRSIGFGQPQFVPDDGRIGAQSGTQIGADREPEWRRHSDEGESQPPFAKKGNR